MNRQKVFVKVINHLCEQGERARGYVGCVYRASNGYTCAVGCLIDAHAYSQDLEGKIVSDPAIRRALTRSGVDTSEETLYLLDDLQALHDRAIFWVSDAHRASQVRLIAGRYGLALTGTPFEGEENE